MLIEREQSTELAGRDASQRVTATPALLAATPRLRAFALSLAGHDDRADDLVQETLLRAWANFDRFEPGTSLNAWLFTILRNLFLTEYRKRKRDVEDPDGAFAARLAVAPEQDDKTGFADFRTALARLPIEQREALLLIGAEGLTYEEAARVCGIPSGTMKSRASRARKQLTKLLGRSS